MPKKSIDFQGETLLLSSEITETDVKNYLNYSLDSYNKNLRSNVENEIEWSKVPSEIFWKILYASVAKYPDMKKENYTEADYEFVKKGLPELKNKEEAFTIKKHIVVDYLEILIGKEIKKEVKKYLQGNKGAKPSNINSWVTAYNALNPTEQDCAAAFPAAAIDVKTAKDKAIAYFGSHTDGSSTNSQFHAFWSAGMVKEVCHTTLNKWKGLNRAKIFATAHEYDTKDVLNCATSANHTAVINVRLYDLCNYMDLNNNLVGRTYMYNTVGQTWLGNANNIPSWATIYGHVTGLSSTYKSSISDILNVHSSFNINSLGDVVNAMDYHTPTAGQLVRTVN